ncbi:MAG: glycosyltransferase family 2 protein [Candidatus Gottesmanbacteria bacterium]
MKTVDISVIILNFNTLALTKLCIESLMRSKLGKFSMEVIVCDNASTDGTDQMIKKEFPDVVFIQNGGNIGFAAGNNPGIKKAKGRYVLLLNSDTEVNENTLAAMILFMDDHPKAGVSTCKLILMDGSMDPACHRGMPTPWNAFTYYTKLEKMFPKAKAFSGYHQLYKNLSTAHEVDSISGAFFLVRREVIQNVGMLDEAYFMYGEDIDWAYRIKEAGWEIWYNPTVTILHKKKQSGRSHTNRERRIKTQTLFITNNKLFYKKHYGKKYPRIVTWLVYLAFDIQMVLLKVFGI